MSDQPDAETSIWQHTTLIRERNRERKRDIHAPGEFRTCNPNNPAATGISSQSILRLVYRMDFREKNVSIQGREENFLFSQAATHSPSNTKFRLSSSKARSLSYAITFSLGLSLHTPRSRILLAEILVRFIIVWAKYTLCYSKIHYGAAPASNQVLRSAKPFSRNN